MSEPTARIADLHIEVECGSDPIRGAISGANGARARFTGWMELATALERALGESVTGGAEPDSGLR
jgi:hypothetical protein